MNPFMRVREAIILVLLCLISFFSFLDAVDVDLMEARNFVAAREMIENGNWLIPTMNGEIRLAKPPMPTWFAALSAKLAGDPQALTALRLPSALAACLLILAVYGLSRAIGRSNRAAFWGAAMLTTSVLMIDIGRTGSWDIFCHAFMAAALWALWRGLSRRGEQWWPFLLAGVGLGLSFMSKGPVSFFALLLPFSLAYLLVFGLAEVKQHRRGLAVAAGICLLLSCWWPLYIFVYHADLGLLVAQRESDAWASRHVQPLWYYWHFIVFSGCWLAWAGAALIWPYTLRRVGNRQRYLFFVLWLAITLILLSLIPEKKERYLLPAMIPLFCLAGDLAHSVIERFAQHLEQRTDRALLWAHTWLLSALDLGVPLLLIAFLRRQGQVIDGMIVAYTLLSWGLAVVLLQALRQRQVERLMLVSLASLALTTVLALANYGTLTTRNGEYQRVDRHLLAGKIAQSPVYFLGDPVDMRVVWDLGQQVYPWQADEVAASLKRGQPVAVLSKGDAAPLLPPELREQVLIRDIGTFDYNKKRRDTHKIHLSLLTTTNHIGGE